MLLLNIIEIRAACFLLSLKFGSLVVQLQESNLDKGGMFYTVLEIWFVSYSATRETDELCKTNVFFIILAENHLKPHLSYHMFCLH